MRVKRRSSRRLLLADVGCGRERGPRHHGHRRRTGRPDDVVLGGDARGQLTDHRLAARHRRPAHHAVPREVDLRRPRPPRILAKDLVEQLREQARRAVRRAGAPRAPPRSRDRLEDEADCVVAAYRPGRAPLAHADRSRAATAPSSPRSCPSRLDMAPWEGRGAHYLVGDKAAFAGKRVVIVGGGDSAFDWVLNLLDTAGRASRWCTAARASAHTRSTVPEVKQRGRGRRASTCACPYVSQGHEGNGAIERRHRCSTPSDEGDVAEVDVRRRPAAARLHRPSSARSRNGASSSRRARSRSTQLMKTSLDASGPCGDITTFDGKLKLIATGFARGRHRRRAGRPLHPARHEDPAEVLDQHRRARARRGPGRDRGRRAPAAADPVMAALIDRGGPLPEPADAAGGRTSSTARWCARSPASSSR